MPYIRFAAISSHKDISCGQADVISLSAFSEEIKKNRAGFRSFVLGPLDDRDAVNRVALAVADLSMAHRDLDFHFMS